MSSYNIKPAMSEIELLQKVIALLKSEPKLRERYEEVIGQLERELKQARLDRYRVGVIGVTSSGKSTMINAILDDRLLSMAVKPSSSQLVTCSKSDKKMATVYFENRQPVKFVGASLTPDIIRRYSDENYNTNNRERVKQLELSTPNFDFPSEILLVDSPGLDAYGLEGHEKLTLNSLLPTIDFCIFVTTLKTNSDDKMRSILDMIAEYNCPLIIVQNMLDAVKPSPDGKKSSVVVAEEHKRRVERIVNYSKVTDKSSVKIVQISSKLALDGRLEHNAAKLKKSNYNKLIDAVKSTFERVKPKIEANRMDSIRKRLNELVAEARHDNSTDISERQRLVFEFEGKDTALRQDSQKTYDDLGSITGALRVQAEYLNALKSGGYSYGSYVPDSLRSYVRKYEGSFKESNLDNIKTLIHQCENCLIGRMKQHNKVISEYCRKLGVMERRIRTVDSFGEIPGLRVHKKEETYREKKSGIGSAIGRFFGGLFDTDWGYVTKTRSVYDEKATLEDAVKTLYNYAKAYAQTCDKWITSDGSVVNELCGEIATRRRAFEKRRAEIKDKQAMLNVINGLDAVIRDIPVINPNAYEQVKHTETDLETKLSTVKVSRSALALYKISEHIKTSIHQMTVRRAGIKADDTKVIVSWDPLCASMLLKNCFDVTMSEDSLKGTLRFGSFYIVNNPEKSGLQNLAYSNQLNPLKWIVLFNATQHGSAMKALSSIGLPDCVKLNKDNLYLVVQDFEEVRNGGGAKDSLINMKTVCEDLGMNCRPFILLNDNNPIYSLAAVQVQEKRCETHSDEIALINHIQESFSYLLNPVAEKVLHDIIQAF